MRQTFNILTLISMVVMTITILLQTRGSGLGSAFGGEGNMYRSRRGAERVVFNATVLSAIVFVLSVILGLLSKG
jgi:preprotein translocase subunit SecG